VIESLLAVIGFVIVGLVLIYAYDCWIQPQLTRRWINKTLEKIRSGKLTPSPKQSNYGITVDAAGFAVSQVKPTSAPLLFIAWIDVLRVTAFKRDWLTFDCICMAISTKDGLTTELNEEMAGWETFTEALKEHLPGSVPWADCFSRVAFPAFATNETEIFVREGLPELTKTGTP
jgi:hypothetical protein